MEKDLTIDWDLVMIIKEHVPDPEVRKAMYRKIEKHDKFLENPPFGWDSPYKC